MSTPMEQTLTTPAPAQNERQLRNFIINRRFQMRWMGSILALTLLLFGTLGGYIYWQEVNASEAVIAGLSQMYEPEDAAMMAELFRRADGGVIWGLIATCGALIVMLAGVSMVLTHRIAGPMYAIARMHEAITGGDYRIARRFRKNDEFKEVSNSFGDMVSALRNREEIEIARLEAIRTIPNLPADASRVITDMLAEKRARV